MSKEAMKLALEALEGSTDKTLSIRAITALREALAEQPAQTATYTCGVCGVSMQMEPPAQQEPEFFTHCVDQPYDWSEWVCPDPKGYLMKCCDCGLVHEAEFGVVRYKSETEREDCDMVDDPNLQAVFRMRRSEQWTPKDTAYRPGGLAQPKQEPVAYMVKAHGMLQRLSRRADVADEIACQYRKEDPNADVLPLYTSPPAQRKPLDAGEISRLWKQHTSEDGPHHNPYDDDGLGFARAIEAKLKELE